MTTTLTREARYARIAEHWPELQERCECVKLLEAQLSGLALCDACYLFGAHNAKCGCGGKGWTPKADPWALLVAAYNHGMEALKAKPNRVYTAEVVEAGLLTQVERRLGLEE